jgi:D-amino-acid dehydrogenase
MEHVTVIGAGVVGICTALSLAEKGVMVRLIDRAEPGQGASYGNAGVVAPHSIVPNAAPGLWKKLPGWLLSKDGPVRIRPEHALRFIPWGLKALRHSGEAEVRRIAAAMEVLNRDNVALYRRHLAGTGHEGLIQDSMYVYAYRDGAAARLDGLDAEVRQSLGAKMIRLSQGELRELEPDLAPEFEAALAVVDQGRATNPGRVGQVLTEKLMRMGGEVIRADVKGLARAGEGWRVETSAGAYESAKVVVTAGAWSARLLAPLGLKLPLQAERGYHVMFPETEARLRNSVMDTDAKIVASTMEMGLRAAGTAEFGDADAPPDPARAAAVERALRRLVPGIGAGRVETWMGVRPSFPDSLPVIGEMPGLKGLYGGFGHSHWGFMMAPKTGAMLADLVTEARVNMDLSAYSAARF